MGSNGGAFQSCLSEVEISRDDRLPKEACNPTDAGTASCPIIAKTCGYGLNPVGSEVPAVGST